MLYVVIYNGIVNSVCFIIRTHMCNISLHKIQQKSVRLRNIPTYKRKGLLSWGGVGRLGTGKFRSILPANEGGFAGRSRPLKVHY